MEGIHSFLKELRMSYLFFFGIVGCGLLQNFGMGIFSILPILCQGKYECCFHQNFLLCSYIIFCFNLSEVSWKRYQMTSVSAVSVLCMLCKMLVFKRL